ncbi:21216_t:CDS:2, partial [Gigaspora rosea]
WNLSVKKIDSFFECQDTRGYKFEIDPKGNVFIVEMENVVHASVEELLRNYFYIPNRGVIINPPINVMGSSKGKPSAPDIAIYPGLTIIPMPPIPAPPPRSRLSICSPRPSRHLEIPAVDASGKPHARIMCEIAVSQSYHDWNAKCSCWMQQQYVRCVFGVKFYRPKATQNANGQPDSGHVYTAVAGQVGVYYEEWNFGTLDYYTDAPTTCTGPGLGNYQVNIPTQYVFWNPPIVGGAPATAGYVINVPPAVIAPNFIIDLFQIQQ